MPVIAFSSPKGGAGKTTAATILATVLAELNTRIPVVVVTHDISSLARQVTRVAFVNRTLTEPAPAP